MYKHCNDGPNLSSKHWISKSEADGATMSVCSAGNFWRISHRRNVARVELMLTLSVRLCRPRERSLSVIQVRSQTPQVDEPARLERNVVHLISE